MLRKYVKAFISLRKSPQPMAEFLTSPKEIGRKQKKERKGHHYFLIYISCSKSLKDPP